MEDKKQGKSATLSNTGAVAAGLSTAAITGGAGSFVAGMRRFGDTAVEQARLETERLIEQIPGKVQEGMENTSNLVNKESIFESFRLQGDSEQVARLRTEREYVRRLEALAADNARWAALESTSTAEFLGSRLKQFERNADKWKASSFLEKPLLGFKGAGISTKLGIVSTAAALGIGTGWVLHARQGSGKKISFEEEVRGQMRNSGSLDR